MTKTPVIIYPDLDGHRSAIETTQGIIVEWSTALVVMDRSANAPYVRSLALSIKCGREFKMIFLPGELAKNMAQFIAKEFP
ncbi:MAG TPA: hypothetical protein VHS96_03825 [Bacteroidia bacterium]|nr:hypothetical protein [Bacteroidia bacterium]